MGFALIVLGLMLSLSAHAYSGFLHHFAPSSMLGAVRALDHFIKLNLVDVFGRPATVLIFMLTGFIAAYVLYWRAERRRVPPQASRKIVI